MGISLDAEAYLAALSSIREPDKLRRLVLSMAESSRFRWLRRYADEASANLLALSGALRGQGRRVEALADATPLEVRTGLQAISMSTASVGAVSALLQDLRASDVPIDTPTRCMLLTGACLEGWTQQQVAMTVWLPLLSPQGEALLDEMRDSLRFVRTPSGSRFYNNWCFDWRQPHAHPLLWAWLSFRARTDPRFRADDDEGASGLCPVDIGVSVLEGLLLGRILVERRRCASPDAAPIAGQLQLLLQSLLSLVAKYERADVKRGRGGFSGGTRGRAQAYAHAPALGTMRGISRELLRVIDLQNGLRYRAQLQSAKVFSAALEQLLRQLADPTIARVTSGLRGARRTTKREAHAAFVAGTRVDRHGHMEVEVDPSPMRTTVATAAVVYLLAASPPAEGARHLA